jgi:hypothetical protein
MASEAAVMSMVPCHQQPQATLALAVADHKQELDLATPSKLSLLPISISRCLHKINGLRGSADP